MKSVRASRPGLPFDNIVFLAPLEKHNVGARAEFDIAGLLIWAIGKRKHSLLVQCTSSEIRGSWFAHLLEYPKGVRYLVMPPLLAEYPSENSSILEGLCSTLCIQMLKCWDGSHKD